MTETTATQKLLADMEDHVAILYDSDRMVDVCFGSDPSKSAANILRRLEKLSPIKYAGGTLPTSSRVLLYVPIPFDISRLADALRTDLEACGYKVELFDGGKLVSTERSNH